MKQECLLKPEWHEPILNQNTSYLKWDFSNEMQLASSCAIGLCLLLSTGVPSVGSNKEISEKRTRNVLKPLDLCPWEDLHWLAYYIFQLRPLIVLLSGLSEAISSFRLHVKRESVLQVTNRPSRKRNE